MSKPIRVILDGDAKTEFKRLSEVVAQQIKEGKENSQEMQLLNSVNQKLGFIKSNPFYGDCIPKRLLPPEYKVSSLWRVELSNFWRMLYTLKGDQKETIAQVIDILDHDSYNKKFGYKKK